MKLFFLYIFLLIIAESIYAELPIVKAVGGEGKNINWDKIQKEQDSEEGPGFFYHDCYQGVIVKSVSSHLKSQGKKNYNGDKLIDNDPRTAWMVGNIKNGIGEYLEIKSPIVNIIYNGYQASPKLWKENSRVKKFKVYRNNKPICYLELKDEMGSQRFELPNSETFDPYKESVFKFEIVETYKGTKWNDVGISHIDYGGCCFSTESKISGESKNIPIQDITDQTEILSFNLNTQATTKDIIKKVVTQKHLVMLRLSTHSRIIEVTPSHPLYIKDYGFISMARLLNLLEYSKYEELIGKVEFFIYNDDTKKMEYEKLKDITIIKGEIETYSIKDLAKSNTFIVNGFLSKTY